MRKYHKYVFDQSTRTFVGDFESMYANESVEGFDSWHQEDCRQLQRKITLQLIEGYNFQKILDFGCGKGAFTHLLKKINNDVVGIDISETAISIAASRYPDITFKTADVSIPECLPNIYKELGSRAKIDLTVCIEILSYLPDWRGLLKTISCHSKYLLISLDIPPNPIGFVKSSMELIAETEKHFELIEVIQLKVAGFTLILGKSK